jgi:hypothetical protein
MIALKPAAKSIAIVEQGIAQDQRQARRAGDQRQRQT